MVVSAEARQLTAPEGIIDTVSQGSEMFRALCVTTRQKLGIIALHHGETPVGNSETSASRICNWQLGMP